MNVFALRNKLVGDYSRFEKGFLTVRDAVIGMLELTYLTWSPGALAAVPTCRTKETILSIYDEAPEAARTGIEYKTRRAQPRST